MSKTSNVRIVPGQWRPHYPFEQIAWVSPSWPSPDYVWLDFPEAIFTDRGLLFLSHVSKEFPVVFPGLPAMPWQRVDGGIRFDRSLPDGVRFGGSVMQRSAGDGADLELYIENGSQKPLGKIKLQTCAFLRSLTEFDTHTDTNKFVHLASAGWTPMAEALKRTDEAGRYRVGWRAGPTVADLPVSVAVSSNGQRLIAFTWGEDTYSMINNPRHPCIHADPAFPTLAPGQKYTIRGWLLFLETTLDAFDVAKYLG